MKTTLRILALTLLGAASGLAQTPTPSPTPTATPLPAYLDGKQPVAARLASAQSVIATATDPSTIAGATVVYDSIFLKQATTSTWNSTYASLAQSIIAAKGVVTPAVDADNASLLMWIAVNMTCNCAYTDYWDRATYLRPFVNALSTTDTSFYASNIIDMLAGNDINAAKALIKTGDYTDAATLLADPAVFDGSTYHAIMGVFTLSQLHTAMRSSDALSYAKAAYLVSAFKSNPVGQYDTQAGINAVSAAFRALEGSLTDSNAFIQQQNNATAPDLLANTPIPAIFTSGTAFPAQLNTVNLVLSGNKVGAINAALSEFSNAQTNNDVNNAVADMARTLRDYYDNIVEANNYVAAMQAGAPYTFNIPGVTQAAPMTTPTPTPTPSH